MSDDGYTRITLRIPDELHRQLSAEASRTSKSMNAEIIGRLEQSFQHPSDLATTLTPDEASLLLRSRLSAVQALIRQLEDEVSAADFDHDVAATVRSEIESLLGFETRIRHALIFVLKAKYADAPIQQEYLDLISDLMRLNF